MMRMLVVLAAAALQVHRNPFVYNAPPPPAKRRPAPVVVAAPVPAPAPQVVAALPAEPLPPPFPYRYVGSFGPRENAFAVFARDGEVINARVGELIAERFRLRRIDAEAVDLLDEAREVRVAIAK